MHVSHISVNKTLKGNDVTPYWAQYVKLNILEIY